ncbi:dienelactone hydrolase family protein [Gluconobacter sp.]|uniref:dienelactone hydrolase family protein n=1 Tax=Gluconobacter sp. TaxID=1876758 RepID=UPI0039EAAA77
MKHSPSDNKTPASSANGHMTSLTASDGHTFKAWEAGSAESPLAVIVVQEIFGLTPHIRNVCNDFAAEGFHVLAPAVFDRAKSDVILEYTQAGVTEGLELRSQIPSEKTLADIAACAKALRDAGHKKVGIIGFCWGGLLAWLTATRTHDVDAAVSWYGGSIGNHVETAPNCPVELHFGGEDSSIPHTEIQKIRDARPEVEEYVYDDAGHGFGCPERPSFNRDARDLAWSRSVDFLKSHLEQK